eukprot:GABU01004621.1.p2 GENE.GABU01004621.1~~GABU01004621.1.p2  ORF type:complete len:119 (-),score=13.81 GABU01004621.1:213-569(-)
MKPGSANTNATSLCLRICLASRDKNKVEYKSNAKLSNAVIVANSLGGGSSFSYVKDDVPMIQVYDQTAFVEKREGDIKKLHQYSCLTVGMPSHSINLLVTSIPRLMREETNWTKSIKK